MATACEIVKRALDRFKSTLSRDDIRTFSDTTYKELWEGAHEIEQEQGRRMDLRFMRRIEPFLVSMESYASVIEVFCQGFTPMAFVWGPVKLILLLARNYSGVMEKILKAFSDIAEVLPRMDRLKTTFGTNSEFQQVLASIFSDIIEFHRRAYKMFRRKAWHVWFTFDWGLFERRFKSIISRLGSHCDLLDKEAASIHFEQMKAMRDKRIQEDEATEQYRHNQMMQDVVAWLSAAEDAQEEYLHNLSDRRLPGTCNFVFEDPNVSAWAEDEVGPGVVWLTGIPGAGKSFVSSLIVQHLQIRREQSSLYYFCGQKSSERNSYLAPLVHQAYLIKGSIKSSPTLKRLLKDILSSLKFTYIVLDGVDECEPAVQRDVLKDLTEIQRHAEQHCRILVSSRHEPLIQKSMAKPSHMSLEGRTTESLKLYIQAKITELQDLFPDISSSLWSDIERKLQAKARGMFLWVRLVTTMLQQQMSEADLEGAVNRLPDGLDEAYGRIVSRIRNLNPTEKDRAFRILFWVCTAYRPVTIDEVADGIALKPGQTALNKKTRSQNVDRHILDVCAPFLERSSRGVLDMVHFSAQEYLLDAQTGPFVNLAQAHFNAAFSCIVNLTSAIGVVPRYNNGNPDTCFETMLVQGSFGLQQYAHRYWAEHTITYLQNIPHLDEQALVLVDALEAFSKVNKRQEPDQGKQTQLKLDNESCRILAALQKLGLSPQVRTLILSWFSFKSRLNEMAPNLDGLQALETWQLSEDDTFLSLINSRLQKLREGLLCMSRSSLPSHIDGADYDSFLARFGFMCRFHDCSQSFDCETDRDGHEASHTVLFPCLLCDFSGRGFRTRNQLAKHIRTYHMVSGDFEIPPTLAAAVSYKPTSASHQGTFRPWTHRNTCWNEQGRGVIQRTLRKVLSRVESDMTLMDSETHGQPADPNASQLTQDPESITSTSPLENIRVKIDAQEYETLREFKDNVYQALNDPKTLTLSSSLEDIDTICSEEVRTVATGLPNFASSNYEASALTYNNEVAQSMRAGAKHCGYDQIAERGTKAPYWSVAEEAEFPSLLQEHGHNTSKIAETLMTKSPDDVLKHLSNLVKSGREDLLQLAEAADARAQQENEISMTDVDTEASLSPDPVTDVSYNETLAKVDLSSTQSKENPEPFVVRLDDLLNYRPQSNPTNKSVSMPQQQAAQVEVGSSAQKRKRRPRRKALCTYCKGQFRDEFAVLKHVDRLHTRTRKAWICEDVSLDKKFFGECKQCSKKKSYSTKHNAFKHLRGAHFTLSTPKETVARWLRETEERNPSSDNKHSDAVAAERGDRLPGPSQIMKRQKTDIDSGSSDSPQLNPLTGLNTLPPMRDRPYPDNVQSPGSPVLGQLARQESPGGAPDGQTNPSVVHELPDDLSFDNLLPAFSGPGNDRSRAELPQSISNRVLVRPDHIPRLPHLNRFEKITCQDQVDALYSIITNQDPSSQAHTDAFQKLEHLSRALIIGVRQWRRENTFAPTIPFSG